MKRLLYFAYGSNMLTARLRARCPGAEPLCVGYAEGYRLAFAKRGRDLSGKGHLVRAGRRVRQPGVLFAMDAADRDRLDAVEGLGSGYDRHDAFPVRRADDGRRVTAFVYLASDPEPGLVPYDWYLALIVAGAREHRFDRRRVRALLEVARIADAGPALAARDEAFALLAAAGASADVAAFSRRKRSVRGRLPIGPSPDAVTGGGV